jgi:hypothetical protein
MTTKASPIFPGAVVPNGRDGWGLRTLPQEATLGVLGAPLVLV